MASGGYLYPERLIFYLIIHLSIAQGPGSSNWVKSPMPELHTILVHKSSNFHGGSVCWAKKTNAQTILQKKKKKKAVVASRLQGRGFESHVLGGFPPGPFYSGFLPQIKNIHI